VPDRVGQGGRDLGHQDVQLVVVVHLEHLGHQARAHRVGLAGVAVDFHSQLPASRDMPTRAVFLLAGGAAPSGSLIAE
jgi:hypothetical protein